MASNAWTKTNYSILLPILVYIWGPILLEKASEINRLIYGGNSKPFFSKFGVSMEVLREIRLEESENMRLEIKLR